MILKSNFVSNVPDSPTDRSNKGHIKLLHGAAAPVVIHVSIALFATTFFPNYVRSKAPRKALIADTFGHSRRKNKQQQSHVMVPWR
jgi:hypothetical protein